MKITKLGPNQTEIASAGRGATFLVSYETPVAILVQGKMYVTTKKWSNTTSKHIASWKASHTGYELCSVSQSRLDSIYKDQ